MILKRKKKDYGKKNAKIARDSRNLTHKINCIIYLCIAGNLLLNTETSTAVEQLKFCSKYPGTNLKIGIPKLHIWLESGWRSGHQSHLPPL